MSRREGRDSDSRYHRSRLDREPSPKRVRRDGKTTDRPGSNHNLDSAEHIDRDQKHHRRVQDSASLVDNVVPDLSKESDKKSNGYRENNEPPRSRSHFQQHDDRAGQVGRSFRHRDTTERGWWKDSKDDHQSGRFTNRSSNNDEKLRVQVADSKKKRPSFRETKTQVDKSATTAALKPVEGGETVVVDQERDSQRLKFQARDRSGGGGGGWYRGRGDRFNGGRQGQGGGGRVEKWKHDLYDEGNKSPASKNEEDQIAKVEALLAS